MASLLVLGRCSGSPRSVRRGSQWKTGRCVAAKPPSRGWGRRQWQAMPQQLDVQRSGVEVERWRVGTKQVAVMAKASGGRRPVGMNLRLAGAVPWGIACLPAGKSIEARRPGVTLLRIAQFASRRCTHCNSGRGSAVDGGDRYALLARGARADTGCNLVGERPTLCISRKRREILPVGGCPRGGSCGRPATPRPVPRVPARARQACGGLRAPRGSRRAPRAAALLRTRAHDVPRRARPRSPTTWPGPRCGCRRR